MDDKKETTTTEMTSIFTLYTFHLHRPTFQQHLHMEYVYIRAYLLVNTIFQAYSSYIMISLIDGCC
jgi:hypothetical protein